MQLLLLVKEGFTRTENKDSYTRTTYWAWPQTPKWARKIPIFFWIIEHTLSIFLYTQGYLATQYNLSESFIFVLFLWPLRFSFCLQDESKSMEGKGHCQRSSIFNAVSCAGSLSIPRLKRRLFKREGEGSVQSHYKRLSISSYCAFQFFQSS